MSYMYSPLRYPGGKARLIPFIRSIFEYNGLCDAHYVEPYAGGAGIGLSLLLTEYSRHIYLNDLSYPLTCAWEAILNDTEYMTRRVASVRVTPNTWKRQRQILAAPDNHEPAEVGFAFFFLNRTNRSGIINGGMIGGNDQTGRWKIDARFGRDELIRRIEQIAEYRDRISIFNMDAIEFLKHISQKLPPKAFIYLDPPYYMKGSRLYTDYYRPEDHTTIAEYVQNSLWMPWIVTYDNAKEIAKLYSARRTFLYNLNYSACAHRKACELLIPCDLLRFPKEGVGGVSMSATIRKAKVRLTT